MLMYHSRCSADCSCRISANKMKKEYKSVGSRKKHRYSSKNVCGGRSKKSKAPRKKKISNKNAHFLERIGLKVKQNIGNCLSEDIKA